MTAILGTNVPSAVRPFDSNDAFPTVYANEAKGGHHAYATLAEMYAISAARRVVGMECTVSKITYTLINEPGTAATTASDWAVLPVAAGSVLMSDGKTDIESAVKDVSSKSAHRYVVFCLQPVKVGVSTVEIMLPFAGNVESLTANCNSDATLTKDIAIDLESSVGTWAKAASVTIPSGSASKSGSTTLATALPVVATTKLRCNITSVQDGISTVQVVVAIKQTA